MSPISLLDDPGLGDSPGPDMSHTDGIHDPPDFITQVRDDISQTSHPMDLVYPDVDHTLGTMITDILTHDDETESSGAAINYNAITRTLWIRMQPTDLLQCHLNWFREEIEDWRDTHLLHRRESRLLKLFSNITIGNFRRPHHSSRITPSFCIRPRNQYFPSLVIESGWPESWTRMTQDMRLWLVGGRPDVQVVILLKWSAGRGADRVGVEGLAQVYVRDTFGYPSLRQNVSIFPANDEDEEIRVSWGELFGSVIPGNRDPGVVLSLSVDNLRREAGDALVRLDRIREI